MTSKTFKSALDSPVTLEVERETHPAGVYLTIGQATILLGASDAPALALAILEAAGVVARPSNDDPGTPGNLGRIAYQLMIHIEDAENITAEAEAQAKLEAEALELCNEYFDKECAWSDINDGGQALWLRMARKAREIAKEAAK